MQRRAFTLAEVMVALVIIGVLAAVSIPGIRQLASRAEADRAVRENATAVAAARDNARGRGVCLDYIVREASRVRPVDYPAGVIVPGIGPYEIDIWAVDCVGDPDNPTLPSFVFTRSVAESISQVLIRPVIGTPQAPTDRVHFHRDGSLYDPVAQIQVDATVDGAPRRFKVYPAAGTIEIDEQ